MNKRSDHATGTPSVDWSALFFDPANDLPGKFMARARKRYGDSPDAESAYNYALDVISADAFADLDRRYAGVGSAAGFLAISFFNQMEEYARHKYPRVRPPAWLKRLGDLWVRTWQMLCLQRQGAETIVDALGQSVETLREEIRQAMTQIKARVPNCGRYVAEQTTLDGMDTPPAFEEEDVSEKEIAVVLLRVLGAMIGENAIGPAEEVALERLGQEVVLSDQERLLLQLIYEQGHKIASAGRALGLQRKQTSRLHAAVLARLRTALTPLGFR